MSTKATVSGSKGDHSNMQPRDPEVSVRIRTDQDAEMSHKDFAAIAGRIHKDTGIVITPAKRSMLISRLSRRLRQLGMQDFSTYAKLLDSTEGEAERSALISVITTNVTGFFREPHHFEALAALAPALIERARSGGRVRMWSAGCSTGQEAYSMAATIQDLAPDIGRYDLRILATDIDPSVIECARSGVYERRLFTEKPPEVLRRFLCDGPVAGQVAIADALRPLIRFEVLNLLETWPFQGNFDVIFCRNVVIYFDSETRHSLWKRFAGRLPVGGVLFVGHSERMDPRLDHLFSSVGITQYRRSKQMISGEYSNDAMKTLAATDDTCL